MKYLFILVAGCVLNLRLNAADYPTLPIGSAAPAFTLKGTDLKTYSLQSFAAADVLVIIFTCNHCAASQAYEDRIRQLSIDYAAKNVQVVAIMPNSPLSIRLDELGYTEYGDSFDEMRIRARDKNFNFPYLYDGDTQGTAKEYGPVATPHVFIFDKKRILQYTGRIDDMESPAATPANRDARNAIEALLAGTIPTVTVTSAVGCAVKWDDAGAAVKLGYEEWAKEPVRLDSIGEQGLKKLMKNDSGRLLLVNVWATWCLPCLMELPDFVTINRMYRRRSFTFVTISADKMKQKAKALATLSHFRLSATNYIFNSDDVYKLVAGIDPKWQGELPYTLLIGPGGKIIYAKHGGIQMMFLKKKIVDHPLLGRFN